jgi:hypothetical protein
VAIVVVLDCFITEGSKAMDIIKNVSKDFEIDAK